MTINLSSFFLYVCIFGYGISAAVADILSVSNSYPATVFRIVFFCTSLTFIFHARMFSAIRSWGVFCLLFFITLYVMRFFADLYAGSLRLFSPFEYFIFVICSFFVPVLGAVSVRIDARKTVKFSSGLILILLIVLLVRGDTYVFNSAGEYTDINRLNLAKLNPISLGHIALTGYLLGLVRLDYRNKLDVVSVSLCVVGMVLVILANSRSSILILLLLTTFIAFSSDRVRGKGRVLFVVAGLVAGVYAGWSETITELRAFDKDVTSSLSVVERVDTIYLALEQISQNIAFGSSIEVYATGGYPHNMLIEAVLATGVFGALFLVLFLLILSIRVIFFRDIDTFFGRFLTIAAGQYMLGSLTSGSVYSAYILFVLGTVALNNYPLRSRW